MSYLEADSPGLQEALRRFGAELRRCGLHMGLGQMQLAERSGVSLSTISRIERGKAAHAATLKLVLLSDAMEPRLPLGF